MQDSRPLFPHHSCQHSTYGTRNPLAACQVTVTPYIPHACDTSSAAMATVGGGAVPSQWDVSFNQNVMNYAWARSHLMRLMTERSHDLIKLQLLGSEWHLVFIHPIIHLHALDFLKNRHCVYSAVSGGLEAFLHVSLRFSLTPPNKRYTHTPVQSHDPLLCVLWHQTCVFTCRRAGSLPLHSTLI